MNSRATAFDLKPTHSGTPGASRFGFVFPALTALPRDGILEHQITEEMERSHMTAREKLKAAIAKATNLESQKEKLETALKTATDAVGAGTEDLGRFSDLDAAIKKFRVDAVKNGGNSRDLPQGLKDRLTARRNAEEEIEQAASTREAIVEELDDIRKRLAPMNETKIVCAIDVLREYADVAAAELIALNERRRDLTQILDGLANLSFVGHASFVGYSPTMSKAMTSFDYQFAGNLTPQSDMGARWLARINALLEDPDAELTLPQTIKPSDYDATSPAWKGPGHPHPVAVVRLRSEELAPTI
jgi:hypothetical protein